MLLSITARIAGVTLDLNELCPPLTSETPDEIPAEVRENELNAFAALIGAKPTCQAPGSPSLASKN
jgi:hypothetical protein